MEPGEKEEEMEEKIGEGGERLDDELGATWSGRSFVVRIMHGG
jgi:hypothetical protein